jgi:hypothetical protein
MALRPLKACLAAVALAAAAAAILLPSASEAGSAKLGKKLCERIGGGRFVDIPEFPGERIDRRLLKDIAWMRDKFKILVADGYSNAKSHQRNGEHPLGLAIDVLPDESIGGDWGLINDLARWAEPRQNQTRPAFRWVGYWGDKRHGPRDHLHISWNHSPTRPKHVARTVTTLFCP